MKTKRKINLLEISIFILIIIVSGCRKSNIAPIHSSGLYEDGYFITNEGNYGVGNGSISFVNEYGIVENDVFAANNSFLLGDVVQSMSIINDNAYIIVNNSQKIEVVSADSMLSISTIDVSSPRYIAKVSENKAYVTDWGINGVQVLNLSTNTIISTIACGIGPEGIASSNGFAYVCNVGGLGLDNTVSIINTSTDMVENTLIVGDKPNSVVVDANGAVWVLSGGFTEYGPAPDYEILSQTAGSLVKIVNKSIELSINFQIGNSPKNLVINDAGNNLFFSDGSWSKSVYKMSITDTQLPTTPLINRNFYALGYNGNHIYGTDAVDYVQQGWSFRYTENGEIADSIQAGIIPGGYCFK